MFPLVSVHLAPAAITVPASTRVTADSTRASIGAKNMVFVDLGLL